MSLYDKLFDFQKRIVDKYKDRESLGLFLDMGLGKTPLSLSFAEVNKSNKILIITINAKAIEGLTNKGSWLYWAKEFDSYLNFHSKDIKTSSQYSDSDLLILNYESLFVRNNKNKKERIELKGEVNKFIESCSKDDVVTLIVDESHKVKNLSSLQCGAVIKIQKLLKLKSKKLYTYLLTGTPFTVGYIDLYTQLKLLGYNETKTSFTDKYCVRGEVAGLLGYQQPIVGYKNLDDLYKVIHQYALTIKSEEVIDLPEKIFVNHEIPSSNSFKLLNTEFISGREVYKVLKEKGIKDIEEYNRKEKVANPFFRNIAYPKDKWYAETTGSHWLRARQLSIGFQGTDEDYGWYDNKRVKEIEEFLKNNPDNYIIFYNYDVELIALYNVCERLKFNIDVFCGEIKSLHFYDKYEKMSDEERLNSKNNVLICNFATGSTGKNWELYNKVIIFSIPLFRDYEQALKRVHRIGQNNTVFYHLFYSKNWLDKSMIDSLNEKKQYDKDMFEKNRKEELQ